jgi:WD40 repeat protein
MSQNIEIEIEPITITGHKGTVSNIIWNTNSDQIVSSCSPDKSIRIWNANTGELIKQLNVEYPNVLAISPDGNKVAFGKNSRTPIEIWNINSPNNTCNTFIDPNWDYTLESISWSHDGKYIAAAVSYNNTYYDIWYYILVWDSNGNLMHVDTNNKHKLTKVEFSNDSTKIFTCGPKEDKIYIWKLYNGITRKYWAIIDTINASCGIKSFSLSKDNNLIACIENESYTKVGRGGFTTKGNIILYNINKHEWTQITNFSDKNKYPKAPEITSISLSPDGKYIVAGAVYNNYNNSKYCLELWNTDVNINNYVKKILLCDYYVMTVTWSPDGKKIAAGSLNSTIKIWDVSSLFPKFGGNILKKGKLIDNIKKLELVKIAKMHNVSLKTRDNKVKTKLQLFNSLKRKKLL